MTKEFNLLATTSRGNEGRARYEMRNLLERIGDSAPNVDRTGISGLIAAKTTVDAFEAIKQFRSILQERPYEFRYTLRIIPIQKIVHTDTDQIQKTAAEFASQIGQNETFRITVEKRFTKTSGHDIIKAAASVIKRKVNLTKPDKILLIEVVGGLTGMSLIKPGDVISVLKEKLL